MADGADRLRWIAALLAVLALVAAFSPAQNPLIGPARGYAEEVAKASAATYLSLRTLNAFLSFAQEVEVSGNAIFLEGSVRPLKTLEPIDDTVERIASAVFAVMVTTGVLAVALGPVSGTGCALMALALALWCISPGSAGTLSRRLGLYGGFLGVALPLAFLSASLLSERMTGQVWEKHQKTIDAVLADVPENDLQLDGEEGLWQAMRDRWEGAEQYRKAASALFRNADAVIGSYIAILSVFIFRILVLPLLLVGAFWVAAKHLMP